MDDLAQWSKSREDPNVPSVENILSQIVLCAFAFWFKQMIPLSDHPAQKAREPGPEGACIKPGKVNVVDANMNDMIEDFENNSSTAFANAVTADFHMSAEMAVILKKHRGNPKSSDFVNNYLTSQRFESGAQILQLKNKIIVF